MKVKAFRSMFPIGSDDGCSLQFVPPDEFWDDEEIDLDPTCVTIRVVLWHIDDYGCRTIFNIREYDVDLVGEQSGDCRVDDLILAWVVVVSDVLPKLGESVSLYDLVPRSCPLNLKTAVTAEDFERAYRMKSRLGSNL